MSTPATDLAFLALYSRGGSTWRAAADDAGRLLVFRADDFAALFAARLAGHGLAALTWPVTTSEIAELLELNPGRGGRLRDEWDVVVFEETCLDEVDAERWAAELAERVVGRLG